MLSEPLNYWVKNYTYLNNKSMIEVCKHNTIKLKNRTLCPVF
ncbi:hypothetical protein J502_1032 [Acinetobacter sp. 1294596]|nr:hypothetical protein J579_0823 [Acinetobacter sp. 1239920]EXF57914.1 hypothetical protein J502_1032 [Acinetobacter sp. 1294596]